MLTAIQKAAKIGSGNVRETLADTKGLFKGKLPDAVGLQRQLRGEWADTARKKTKE